MTRQRRKILLITAAGLIIICLIAVFVTINKKKTKTEDYTPEDTDTYITKQVTDYPEAAEGSPRVWETVYDVQSSVSIVYADGKELKRFAGGTVDKAVEFSPEAKEDIGKQVLEITSDKDMDIIYSQDTKQNLLYVAGLINNGYKPVRKVLTSDYAEVYLKTPEDTTIRILVLSDKMLMAELNKDVVLDDIGSYFD